MCIVSWAKIGGCSPFSGCFKGIHSSLFFVGGSGSNETVGVYCGLMAIIGHSFPIYLRFKGGKGGQNAGMLLE